MGRLGLCKHMFLLMKINLMIPTGYPKYHNHYNMTRYFEIYEELYNGFGIGISQKRIMGLFKNMHKKRIKRTLKSEQKR